MSLGLHPNCQAQLLASLAEQLSHAEVRHGMFLTSSTSLYLFLAQAPLPQTGKLHARLQKLVGEAPLVDFVSGILLRELYEEQEYQTEEGPLPLSAVPKYSDLNALADRLVASFESLPWSYTLTTELPQAFSEIFCSHIKSIELTDGISIRCGNDVLPESYPLVSGLKKRDQAISGGGLAALLIPSQPAWKPHASYLQVRVDGFIGKYTRTEPLVEAIGIVRAFYGLALALRLFKPGSSYQPYPLREKVYIHRRIDEQWIIEDVHELESRHSEAIRGLALHDLDGKLDNDAKRAGWMQLQLRAIGTVLRADERAKNVVLGAQWLLDSHCGKDELLQFVQAAVVVEILLGDKASSDLTGLGELLANRCAYLIASTHTQRAEVLQDFRGIYEVRSKIVHRGKSRLAFGERTLFNKLRWMCRRIIQEEVELLEKDNAQKDA
jgi:hypothetical protein